jgi:hypothetical protein
LKYVDSDTPSGTGLTGTGSNDGLDVGEIVGALDGTSDGIQLLVDQVLGVPVGADVSGMTDKVPSVSDCACDLSDDDIVTVDADVAVDADGCSFSDSAFAFDPLSLLPPKPNTRPTATAAIMRAAHAAAMIARLCCWRNAAIVFFCTVLASFSVLRTVDDTADADDCDGCCCRTPIGRASTSFLFAIIFFSSGERVAGSAAAVGISLLLVVMVIFSD